MKIFTYWDNSEKWRGAVILQIELPEKALQTEADVIFLEQTGKNPVKIPSIGCTSVEK